MFEVYLIVLYEFVVYYRVRVVVRGVDEFVEFFLFFVIGVICVDDV